MKLKIDTEQLDLHARHLAVELKCTPMEALHVILTLWRTMGPRADYEGFVPVTHMELGQWLSTIIQECVPKGFDWRHLDNALARAGLIQHAGNGFRMNDWPKLHGNYARRKAKDAGVKREKRKKTQTKK